MKTKEIRITIWNKYNKHCAYCGDVIKYKAMQIDHLIPLRRNDCDHELKRYGLVRGTDDFSNLMPSCRKCNLFKSDFKLQIFREKLEDQLEKANKYSSNYRFAKKYGQVVETPKPIIFYFETIDINTLT